VVFWSELTPKGDLGEDCSVANLLGFVLSGVKVSRPMYDKLAVARLSQAYPYLFQQFDWKVGNETLMALLCCPS